MSEADCGNDTHGRKSENCSDNDNNNRTVIFLVSFFAVLCLCAGFVVSGAARRVLKKCIDMCGENEAHEKWRLEQENKEKRHKEGDWIESKV